MKDDCSWEQQKLGRGEQWWRREGRKKINWMKEGWEVRWEAGCVQKEYTGGEGKGQRGYEFPEIWDFIVYAIGLLTTQKEYEVLFLYFAFGLTLEKAEVKQVSVGMGKGVKWLATGGFGWLCLISPCWGSHMERTECNRHGWRRCRWISASLGGAV